MTEEIEKNIEEMSFEECMSELERLVSILEEGKMDLESSIQIFYRAANIKHRCSNILIESERKINKLIDTSFGAIKESINLEYCAKDQDQ